MISSWRKLGGWLADEREQRLFVEDLERAAKAWAQDREHAPLFRRRRLEDGEELVKKRSLALSDEARGFLTASRRAERRRLLVVVGVTLLALAAAASGVILYLRAVRAEQSKTAAALRDEQTSRLIAEKRTREVQSAQARIDQLLKDLADSPRKQEIRALQEQIREPGVARPSLQKRAKPEPVKETGPAAPAVPTQSPRPSAEPSSVKVQQEW